MTPDPILRAIYAGLFASEVLPLRPGELLRAFLVSKRLNAPVSTIFPSIMVERLFDGVWLAIAIGVVAMLMPLPAGLLHAGDVLGVLILVAVSLFYTAQRSRPHARVRAKLSRTLRTNGPAKARTLRTTRASSVGRRLPYALELWR